MNCIFLNNQLRKVSGKTNATFEEKIKSDTKELCLIKKERAYTRRIDSEVENLPEEKQIGTGKNKEKKQIGWVNFEYNSENMEWNAETPHLKITVLPETPETDLEKWLEATLNLPEKACRLNPKKEHVDSLSTLTVKGKDSLITVRPKGA